MDKYLNKNNLVIITLFFYCISILFDLHIFYNSITTLIRTIIITILFSIIYFKYSSPKDKKYLSFFFGVSITYIILHIINSLNFMTTVNTDFNIFNEILYFYKISMNILIIYIIYKLNINYKLVIKVVKINLWFISGSILLCNILKLGYTSYDFTELKANIFDWFSVNEYNFDKVSGKGFFHLANQIVAILLLYLPLLLNEIKTFMKKSDIILSIIVLLSMLIIGNRLSSAGPLIILIISLIIYILLVIFKMEKKSKNYIAYLLIVIIGYNIFLFNSPLLKRMDYYTNLNSHNEIKNEKNPNSNDNYTYESDINLIDIFNNKKINLNFPINYYPYENDPYFWNKMLKKNSDILSDSRYLEIEISKRIKDLNNNRYDDYFGIGYTRIINVVNIEKDYIMQYYSIGIIGLIIFMATYFIIYIYSGLKMLINLEVKMTYKNMMLFLGCGIFLVSAYFSGNVLNAISTIIPISFILGVLFNELRKKVNISDKILGFNVTPMKSTEIVNNLKKDNRQNIIYNINPMIVTNFYKDKKVVAEFNKEKYQIPDGIGIIFASKMKDSNISKRIGGVDLFYEICDMSRKNNLTICLYGSKEEIVNKAKIMLEKKYKNIKIIKVINGYLKETKAIKEIKQIKPDILFVGLGSPKQELFIIKYKKDLKDIKIIMPVGGTFDVVSGQIKRAPKLIIKYHLEWLYRMINEPGRIKLSGKLFKFIFLVIFRNHHYNK